MNTEDLIGKTEEEAITLLVGKKFRIVKRDGQYFGITMDYCAGRFNLEIENHIVTAVRMG